MSKVRDSLSLNDVDFKCIVCQSNKEEELIQKLNSHEKLLSAIDERNIYGDSQFTDDTEWWSVLKKIPFEEIVQKKTWHRKCHQDTIHSGM